MYVYWDLPHLSLVCVIYHTYLYFFHAGIDDAENATKWEKSWFQCKKNTWHVESNYILQPPKNLIIIVNRFRYINTNVTKDRCSIPMDLTIVLGSHKFRMQATKDHHGPSKYSDHYTTSINKNILLQWQQNYGVWNDWYQKILCCICSYG